MNCAPYNGINPNKQAMLDLISNILNVTYTQEHSGEVDSKVCCASK